MHRIVVLVRLSLIHCYCLPVAAGVGTSDTPASVDCTEPKWCSDSGLGDTAFGGTSSDGDAVTREVPSKWRVVGCETFAPAKSVNTKRRWTALAVMELSAGTQPVWKWLNLH